MYNTNFRLHDVVPHKIIKWVLKSSKILKFYYMRKDSSSSSNSTFNPSVRANLFKRSGPTVAVDNITIYFVKLTAYKTRFQLQQKYVTVSNYLCCTQTANSRFSKTDGDGNSTLIYRLFLGRQLYSLSEEAGRPPLQTCQCTAVYNLKDFLKNKKINWKQRNLPTQLSVILFLVTAHSCGLQSTAGGQSLPLIHSSALMVYR